MLETLPQVYPLRVDMIKPFRMADLIYIERKVFHELEVSIFRTFINLEPNKIVAVVIACCVSHNYLINTLNNTYSPPECVDSDDMVEGITNRSMATRLHCLTTSIMKTYVLSVHVYVVVTVPSNLKTRGTHYTIWTLTDRRPSGCGLAPLTHRLACALFRSADWTNVFSFVLRPPVQTTMKGKPGPTHVPAAGLRWTVQP
ncbi:hypothetical protein PR048_017736 [Dryococelus australis]|uniref:DDE Tnp4 domain-containing protein n=1 Tax=Dryococelus australis TaxID=614101 RepID=A0ABQ9HAK6_9NEOP|nr:hypothetical protein PR048_017736 [Dryococelus australis]